MTVIHRYLSLTVKLTVIITTLVVAAVGGVTVVAIQREQTSFQAELKEQSLLLLDTLEVAIQNHLYNLDVDSVSDLMKALGYHQKLLTSGSVYNAKGHLIADALAQNSIYSLDVDPFGQKLLASDTNIVEWHDNQLIVGRSILLGKQRVGAISIGLSTAPLQQKIVHMRLRGFRIAAIAALISISLSLLISRSIVKPIQKLVEATQSVAKGNFEQSIQIQTGDELSQLANAFNEMSHQLQHTLILLAQQNEELEVRVGQRTAELSQALRDLQQTHAQLIQSEKMSSLGQLVAGVAHEINNPVNFIYGNLGYINTYTQDLLRLTNRYQQQYPNPPTDFQAQLEEIDLPFLKEDLAKILKSMQVGADRIREIILSLRNFSRLDEAEFKVADIHEGIDSTLMILQHRLKATSSRPAIEVVKQYGQIPPIECYPGQLNQVLMNLLTNAIDALEDSNRDRSYEDIENSPNIITIKTQIENYQRLAISISDNGIGISESVITKLFDPFFTTKPVGKGTGLGLSISYQIITEKHRGQLFCESKPGDGTTFTLEIPISQNLPQKREIAN
jgi:signal transduction histidine kinase